MNASTELTTPFERLVYLSSLPALAGLPRQQLTIIAQAVRERFFRRGESVFRADEAIPAVYFVVDGQIAVSSAGRRIFTFGPRTAVGWYGLLAEVQQGLEAVAQRGTLTLELDREALFEIFEDQIAGFAIFMHALKSLSTTVLDLLREQPGVGRSGTLPSDDAPTAPETSYEGLVDRLLFLRRLQEFRGANANGLIEIAKAMAPLHVEPGERLWSEGEPVAQVIHLVRGTVACETATGERFEISAPAVLGAAQMIVGRPHWYSAVAKTKTVALAHHIEVLIDVMEDNIDVGIGALAFLARMILLAAEHKVGIVDGWDRHLAKPRETVPPLR